MNNAPYTDTLLALRFGPSTSAFYHNFQTYRSLAASDTAEPSVSLLDRVRRFLINKSA